MNLLDWFPQQRMKTKREEIKELILKIQSQQQLDRENSGHDLDVGEVCEDLDIGDALESADLIPPISSWNSSPCCYSSYETVLLAPPPINLTPQHTRHWQLVGASSWSYAAGRRLRDNNCFLFFFFSSPSLTKEQEDFICIKENMYICWTVFLFLFVFLLTCEFDLSWSRLST